MWYYIREKKKVGPISDAAVASLFSDGKISESTYVWAPHMPQWIQLKDASIYRSITKAPENTLLRDFKFYTSLLRATLIVWILFLGVKSYYLFEALEFFKDIWGDRNALSNISSRVELSTIQSMLTFVNLFTWVVLILATIATMKWMYSVAEMSRISDSEFKYSPYTSAFSFIIPIFNLILPCRIVWSALKSAINAAKEKISAFDLALFATWWICWAITATVFLTEKITRSNGLENIQVSIYFSMYVIFTIITTSVLWLALVSRISNLYRRIYSNG